MKQRFFLLARKASLQGRGKMRVGACLVIGNQYFLGSNKDRKTHTKSPHPWHPIHAEFDSVNKAGINNPNLKHAEIYVYRIKKDGSQGMAMPCVSCFKFLKDLGIRKMHYTGDSGFFTYKDGVSFENSRNNVLL